MVNDTYVCNGCQKRLSFNDYPPVGGLSTGYTCPTCSDGAKKIWTEITARLQMCGEDGRIAEDLYSKKSTPEQLSNKYGYPVQKIMQKAELCLMYVSSGEKRRDIAYNDWIQKMNTK